MRNKGNYIYQGKPLDLFHEASQTLFDASAHTLGSGGKNTAVPTSNGFLSIINDGKSIIEELSSEDKAMNLALNTLKESSLATNMNAGDGTTSTIVLQHKLLTLVHEHNSLVDLKDDTETITSKMILELRDFLLTRLESYKKSIEGVEDLRKVINVSLGGDTFTDVILEAFDSISKGQKPSIMKTKNTTKTEVVTVNGVSLSPIEANPVVMNVMPHSTEEPLNVILLNQTITRIDKQFANMLQKISTSNQKTILVYTEIMPSVFDQLLFNIQEGGLNLIPIRLACNPDKIDEMYKELERYFNCKTFDSLYSYHQNTLSSENMGTATGYILNKDSIVIKNDNEDYTSEILPAKSSYISVGFITFSQQEENYRRIEDAIHSTYNSLEYGYVIGGGYTLNCLANEVKGYGTYHPLSLKVVANALNYIFSSLFRIGVDHVNYLENNIFDSYKVLEQVIQNSFTVVSQVMSTDCILVNY